MVTHVREGRGRADGQGVMVALDNQRTVVRQGHDALHHLRRVGAVAHQVAQEGKGLCALAAGVVQAGF